MDELDGKIKEFVAAALAEHNRWLETILVSLNRCGIDLARDVEVQFHPNVTRVAVFGCPIFARYVNA